jgi:hypothetical protein
MATDRENLDTDDDVAASRQVRRRATAEDKKLLKKALEQFKQASEAFDPQRKREIEDLEFDAGAHWPEDLLTARGPMRDPVTQKQLPGRPSLTIPKLTQPIQQIINRQREASLAIIVKPKSGGATQQNAEKINGLIRHIQVESRAQIARSWAYAHAVKAGRGYYRILKTWANDGDWDVDLVIRRILNQSSVYLDPMHTEPDGSDAEWAFIVEDIPYARFTREHPKSPVHNATELDRADWSKGGWIGFDPANAIKTVRRAEWWRVVYTERTLCEYESGKVYFEDDEEKPGKRELGKKIRERVVRQPKIKWAKITAGEILEEQDWEGRYIPIVQVIGREFNINGKRLYKGMIADAKDAQRSYNYMRSKQVEAVGLAPLAPYTMVEGQDEGYEEMWASANTTPYSRLIYKPQSVAGQAAPPPQRNSASTDIGAITVAVAAADDDIKAVTGHSDPSLGRSNPADRSGRAIQALQQRTDESAADFLGNLTDISMVHEGRVLLDMLPYVYDRPGRVATLLDEDLRESTQVMLNKPFIVAEDGQPVEAEPGVPGVQEIDLNKGVYRVVVSVAKAHKTQREEAVALLGEIMAAAPQTAPMLTDVLVENVDAPGFPRLARRFKAMLPPQIQALEGGDSEMPPAAAAKISQLEGQLQQVSQAAQGMQQALEQKQVEQQAKSELEMRKAEMEQQIKMAELEMKERIEMEKIRFGVLKAESDANAKIQTAELAAVEQRISQERDLRHDAISQDTQMAHEAAQADLKARVEREKITAAARRPATKKR